MGFKMKTTLLHLDQSRSDALIERRRSSRHLCAGEVLFASEEDPGIEIQGVLRDISEEGFCATHKGVGLSAGQRVRFRHPHGEGSATLMWTRVLGAEAESGFLIGETQAETQN